MASIISLGTLPAIQAHAAPRRQTTQPAEANNEHIDSEEGGSSTGFDFLRFRLQGAGLLASNNSFLASGQISYNPHYGLDENLGFGLNLAYSLFPTKDITTGFHLIEGALTVDYRFHPTSSIELLGGAQYWTTTPNGDLAPVVGANYCFHMDLAGLTFLDRIIAGYELLLANTMIHQIRFGVGFRF